MLSWGAAASRKVKLSQQMTPQEMQEFLAAPRIAVLGTINKDRTAALNPVWYSYDDGRFQVVVSRAVYYGKNVLRDARITLCIQQEAYPYKAVVARGRATVEPDAEFGLMRRLAIYYFGEERGKRYADATWADHGEELLVVTLQPERLASWDYGK